MQAEDGWDRAALGAFEETFEASWVFVGFAREVQRPESWFVYEAGPSSLLVSRDAAGRLGAFVNSCTHRGTRLCSKAGSGKIQCPYHGWVFDAGGRLLGATRRAGLPAFDDADYALVRRGISQIGEAIFVHPDPAPEVDAREGLGESCEALERLGTLLGGGRPAERRDPRPWGDVFGDVFSRDVGPTDLVYRVFSTALLVEREDEVVLVEVRPETPTTSRTRRWKAGL